MKSTNNLETSEELQWKSLEIASNERLDNALYAWFIQQITFDTPISSKGFNKFWSRPQAPLK